MGTEKDPFRATERFRDLQNEYLALLHAVQSGVAMQRGFEIQRGIPEDQRETGPKHLRTGVNSVACDHSALITLLIRKGVFTLEEYMNEIVEELKTEVGRYENRLNEEHGGGGISITLR